VWSAFAFLLISVCPIPITSAPGSRIEAELAA
jgi:hypothetical protein